MKICKMIGNQIGNAMTTSLMVTGGAAAISAFLFAQSMSTEHAAKAPRIKSAMNQVEVSLRSMVLQPSSFNCAQVGATEKADCKINLANLNLLERELPGIDGTNRCKIAIQDSGIGTAGNDVVNGSSFVATLKYVCASDKDAAQIAPQKISVEIPGEVTSISSSTFTCADIDINKPVLVGFNSSSGAGSTGGIKCADLKSAMCGPNQYVSDIDQKTMKVTCKNITSTSLSEATSNSILGGIVWKGPSITKGPAVARKAPSTYPAFGPMFTSSTNVTSTLLGKPAAQPTGGTCACDSPLTTCWDGAKVCAPAGEICSTPPASPTPTSTPASSPNPTVASATPDPGCAATPGDPACFCNAIPGFSWGSNCSGDVAKTAKGATSSTDNKTSGYTGKVTGTCDGNDKWSGITSTCDPVASPTPNMCAGLTGGRDNLDGTYTFAERFGCFVAGTEVTMADGGKKKIEEVQMGELVKTYDEIKQEFTTSPVEEILVHEEQEQNLYTFQLSSGKSLTANEVHPIFAVNLGRYVRASEAFDLWATRQELQLLSQYNQIVKVVDVTFEIQKVKVYNLHVVGRYDSLSNPNLKVLGHNYFANDILVHNYKVDFPGYCEKVGLKYSTCCSSYGGFNYECLNNTPSMASNYLADVECTAPCDKVATIRACMRGVVQPNPTPTPTPTPIKLSDCSYRYSTCSNCQIDDYTVAPGEKTGKLTGLFNVELGPGLVNIGGGYYQCPGGSVPDYTSGFVVADGCISPPSIWEEGNICVAQGYYSSFGNATRTIRFDKTTGKVISNVTGTKGAALDCSGSYVVNVLFFKGGPCRFE